MNTEIEKAILYSDKDRTEIVDFFINCPHCFKKINVAMSYKKWLDIENPKSDN